MLAKRIRNKKQKQMVALLLDIFITVDQMAICNVKTVICCDKPTENIT